MTSTKRAGSRFQGGTGPRGGGTTTSRCWSGSGLSGAEQCSSREPVTSSSMGISWKLVPVSVGFTPQWRRPLVSDRRHPLLGPGRPGSPTLQESRLSNPRSALVGPVLFALRLPLPGVLYRFLALELEPFRSQRERFLVAGILRWNVFCWLVRVLHGLKVCTFGSERALDHGLIDPRSVDQTSLPLPPRRSDWRWRNPERPRAWALV